MNAASAFFDTNLLNNRSLLGPVNQSTSNRFDGSCTPCHNELFLMRLPALLGQVHNNDGKAGESFQCAGC
jgi:hypothetical protein